MVSGKLKKLFSRHRKEHGKNHNATDDTNNTIASATGRCCFHDDLLVPDILILISSQLHLEDVLNCRLVSRKWLAAYNSDAIMFALRRHFWPSSKSPIKTQPELPQKDLFLEESKIHLRRHAGVPLTKNFITWDDGWSSTVFQNLRAPPEGGTNANSSQNGGMRPGNRSAVYGSGKMAWQPSGNRVIVDDLRTHRRQICLLNPTDMLSFTLAAVTDTLLILRSTEVVNGNYSNLRFEARIWHLELEEWKRVLLDNCFIGCNAIGNRAVFISLSAPATLWSWNGEPVDVDVENEYTSSTLGAPWSLASRRTVFLHPFRQDTWFVSLLFYSPNDYPATNKTGTKFIPEVVVAKYQDRKAVQRFSKQVESCSDISQSEDLTARKWTRMQSHGQRTNKYGLYLLASFYSETKQPQSFDFLVGSLSFDTMSETFIQHTYPNAEGSLVHRVSRQDELYIGFESAFTWEDQMVLRLSEAGMGFRWLQADWNLAQGEYVATTMRDVDVTPLEEYINTSFASTKLRMYGDADFMLYVVETGVMVWAFTPPG